MTDMHESVTGAGSQETPSEDELRAAYEAELNRITSSEMIIQTAVSLLNIGGRRLGLAAGSQAERDLDQVRDAIDGVRALMPILERHMSDELRPLRDALAQLQMAYAREAGSAASESTPAAAAPRAPGQGAGAGEPASSGAEQAPSGEPGEAASEDQPQGPGPAEASGRLWVPGR
ncbi:MAG: hypothetical protein ACTHM1_12080 [Solirubrobacteraceae bacterium]